MKDRRKILAVVVSLGVALLLSNTALLVFPTEAADCSVTCPNGKDCDCTGSSCTADANGCSAQGSDGSVSKCGCGKKVTF